MTPVRTLPVALVATAALGISLAGCSSAPPPESDASAVTIIVHDSFPNDDFAEAASAATGLDVSVVSAGDGGELTNTLVLTKGAPVADLFFGVDSTYASRLIDNEVVEPIEPANVPASAAEYAVPGGDGLVPIDVGATCINIDTDWFAAQGVTEPETFEDLTAAEYRDLTVLLDPLTSSTGGSFLVGTVAEFGEEGYLDYWQRLVDNGVRLEQGWSDAYYGQFSGGGEGGTKPIVLSYSSSPAATVNDEGTASSTRALLDTCSSNVEYAGVLAGAANPDGAQQVLEFMLSEEFQQTIPDAMYMYPVDDAIALPEAWAKFAPLPAPEQLHDLAPAEIDAGREGWLKALGEQIGL